MYESDQTTTLAIKPCRCCGVGLIADSKFCRSCGQAQSPSLSPAFRTTSLVGDLDREPPQHYATTRLSHQKLYHPVSGPLVSAVAEGVPANIPRSSTGLSKKMLLALMAVPIWLMIILLSPLDAYASAKIIGNRI